MFRFAFMIICSTIAVVFTWSQFEGQWILDPLQWMAAALVISSLLAAKTALQRLWVSSAAVLVLVGLVIPYQPTRVGSANVPDSWRRIVVYDNACLSPDAAFECEGGAFLVYSRHLMSPFAKLEREFPFEVAPQEAIELVIEPDLPGRQPARSAAASRYRERP